MRFAPPPRWPKVWILACFAAGGLLPRAVAEDVIVKLKDRRELIGGKGYTSGFAEQPRPLGEGTLQPILFVDDYMRRTFVSKRMWAADRYPKRGAPPPSFKIRQPVNRYGPEIDATGAILAVEPFDEHGRRIIRMQGRGGPVDIVQGITELTPERATVEAITVGGNTVVWEMRIPTTSLTSDVLSKLLNQQPGAKSIDHQKKVAWFYQEMQRYEEAQKVLEALLAAHAGDPQTRKQIEQSLAEARRLGAERLIDELMRLRDVGQHALVYAGLEKFPSEGVAGTVLEEARDLLREYQEKQAQGRETITRIKELTAALDDPQLRARIEPIGAEIERELNMNTLGRLSSFRLAMTDEAMAPAERLALGISGWLLGSDAAAANLPNALSAFEVRNLVREYLAEPAQGRRDELLARLSSQVASAPRVVAAILSHMKPPLASDPVTGKPGYYALQAPGFDKGSPVRYLVQTPPEYDPYRTYPTIVTLHAGGSTPEQQIEWWAGSWAASGRRNGQAGRQGYIVIAPEWTAGGQRRYTYSAREHAAVLGCLRDACRRFSIDTDRVYLSGHSSGGDAAWDLGLAHPDLWAGVIPIVAYSGRYCQHYWKNAKYVPFYFVGGEKDGRWVVDNATEFNRYLSRGYNATVVEYLGRGHEHYYDEILRIFDWMGRCTRDFYPEEFSCDSMRPWDNFFWWVEVDGMPESTVVAPGAWPPARGKRPMNTNGQLFKSTNVVTIHTGASHVTVWLSPEVVDFERRAKIKVNSKDVARGEPYVKPDVATMLEDARRRADRKHPFWAKVESRSPQLSRGR